MEISRNEERTEVEKALKECGFGLFHVRVLMTTIIGLMATLITSNSIAFLLPIAECDLQMTLARKGLLAAIPYVGTTLASVFIGFFADAFGRKQTILIGLGGTSILMLISASSQTYAVLVTSKFFEGVLYSCFTCSSTSQIAELCHKGIRDRVLIFISLQICFASSLITAMSWGILINDWKYSFFGGSFVLNTWNIYLYAMSLWPMLGLILYTFVPESPQYLVSQKKYGQARDVLTKIYRENHRYSKNKHPFKDLWKENENAQEIELSSATKVFLNKIVINFYNAKPIFKKPMLYYLILMSMINSLSQIVYNVLRLWFPQIWTIIEHSSFVASDGSTRDVCKLLDSYVGNLTKAEIINTTMECIPKKSGNETYMFTIILNIMCCVPLIFSVILVKKIGKKTLVLFASALAFGAVFAMRWANSKIIIISLFATVLAITRGIGNLIRVMVVEYFPPSARVLTLSVVLVIGQLGSMVGNIVFSILLNIDSTLPFYTLDAVMFSVVAMSLFLPSTRK